MVPAGGADLVDRDGRSDGLADAGAAERRPDAVDEAGTGGLGVDQRQREEAEVLLLDDVDDDHAGVGGGAEERDGVRAVRPERGEVDEDDVVGQDLPLRLLLDPVGQA